MGVETLNFLNRFTKYNRSWDFFFWMFVVQDKSLLKCTPRHLKLSKISTGWSDCSWEWSSPFVFGRPPSFLWFSWRLVPNSWPGTTVLCPSTCFRHSCPLLFLIRPTTTVPSANFIMDVWLQMQDTLFGHRLRIRESVQAHNYSSVCIGKITPKRHYTWNSQSGTQCSLTYSHNTSSRYEST